MSVFDDVLKQQHYVAARANALADGMIAALDAARESLTAQLVVLQSRLLTAKRWQEESLSRRKVFLEAQRGEVERVMAEVYEQMAPDVLSAAQDVTAYISTKASSTGQANRIPFELVSPRLDMEAVRAWAEVSTIDGLTLTEWLGKMANSSATKIVQAGREAMIQGFTVQKTAQLLRQRGIEGSRPSIEALARTYLLSASNHAREQSLESLGADLDFQWLYTATLDGRCCLVCGADDGKIFKKNQSRPSLPRHINCRCTYLPVFGADTLGGVKRPAVKHSGRTVHHKDGSASTQFSVETVEHVSESYSEWIYRQTREDPRFARQVLGKTRFALVRDGKLALEKMIVDGRIKKLSELRG